MPTQTTLSKPPSVTLGRAEPCPLCGDPLMPTLYPRQRYRLLLNVVPDERDRQKMLSILAGEFRMAGLQLTNYSVTYFWRHAFPEKSNFEPEWDQHCRLALRDLRGAEAVLALGTEATEALVGENASEVSGLWLTSNLLPDAAILAGPSLNSIVNGTLGEWRLALQRWKERTRV